MHAVANSEETDQIFNDNKVLSNDVILVVEKISQGLLTFLHHLLCLPTSATKAQEDQAQKKRHSAMTAVSHLARFTLVTRPNCEE